MLKRTHVRTEEHQRKLVESRKRNGTYGWSEEQKQKMSKLFKGRKPWMAGRKHSLETRLKMSKTRKGKPLTEVNKRKISEHHMGKNNPFYGKHHTEKVREIIRKAQLGNKHSLGVFPTAEVRLKISNALKGEKCHLWKGGISFEPYSVDWTNTLRRAIRERDRYVCQLCGDSQEKKVLSVHHIDYDKKNCNPNNLITLCRNCHTRTNLNRPSWLEFFTNRLHNIKYLWGEHHE